MVRIHMSIKELERLCVMEKVRKKEIKLNKAAKILNISKSQSIRLRKRFQQEGTKGLISQKAGKPLVPIKILEARALFLFKKV